ncbi:MAG: hypothetical protein O3A00_00800 [Planctomycetota bacterium]|nr:hypothetical protein [Planctomycetota bacterium]
MAKKSSEGPTKSQAIRDYLKASPGAMPKEVVAALKAQGYDVTSTHVSVVKGGLAGAKKQRKSKINKSQAIRDYLAENPDATAKEIQPALAKKGIVVDAQTINSQKWRMGKNQSSAPKQKPVRPAVQSSSEPISKFRAVAAASTGLSAQDLMDAKAFVDQVGSISDALAALETLEKLQ